MRQASYIRVISATTQTEDFNLQFQKYLTKEIRLTYSYNKGKTLRIMRFFSANYALLAVP